jgi:hypothetical protein
MKLSHCARTSQCGFDDYLISSGILEHPINMVEDYIDHAVPFLPNIVFCNDPDPQEEEKTITWKCVSF